MAKYAEKLTICLNSKEGLLARIHNVKKTLLDPTKRPTVLRETTYSKLCKSLNQKFPDTPPDFDKMPGYAEFVQRADEFRQDIYPIYSTFLDVLDFKEASFALLEDMSKNIITFKLDVCPDLMKGFMRLFVGYVQLQIITASIADRKTILNFYARAFYCVQKASEPNYARMATYITEYEDPIRRIQDEFQPLSLRVGGTIIPLFMNYMAALNTAQLRKDNILNPYANVEQQAQPIVDKKYQELPVHSEIHQWALFAFLCCPGEIGQQNGLEFLELALGQGFILPVYRDEEFCVGPEFERLFGWFKSQNIKLQKHKKMLKEAQLSAAQNSGLNHAERRMFLKAELSTLLNYFAANPGLLAPKIQMVLVGLALARDEIMWYFRHVDFIPPKNAGGKWQEHELRDPNISELISLVDRLTMLVKRYRSVVQSYYIEYLSGPHYRQVHPLVEQATRKNMDSGIQQILSSMLSEMSSLKPEMVQQGAIPSLEAFRLNWQRVIASLSSAQTATLMRFVEELVAKMNVVVQHSHYIDDLDALLDEHGSLRELIWYKEQVMTIFQKGFTGRSFQAYHSMSFLRMLASCERHVHHTFPEERKVFKVECTSLADKFLDMITAEIENLLRDIGNSQLELSAQLEPFNAQENALPGYESQGPVRDSLSAMHSLERALAQLCTAINETETIEIFDSIYCPREYLREHLVTATATFLQKVANAGGSAQVQRPSVILEAFSSLIPVLKRIENYVNVNVDEVIRSVVYEATWKTDIGIVGQPLFDNKAGSESKSTLIDHLSAYYVNMLDGTKNRTYYFSPARKGFLNVHETQHNQHDNVYRYADLSELKALCLFIGPQGVRFIESQVLNMIRPRVAEIKEAIGQNKAMLSEFQEGYTKEHACFDMLHKFRQADAVVNATINIGVALQFRRLLMEAQAEVLKEKTPLIYDCLEGAYRQYPPNIFMIPELQEMDLLAHDGGVNVDMADLHFKKTIQSLNLNTGDAALWQLLPYLYAAAFTSGLWKHMEYRVNVEAHTYNAHCMALAIIHLITAFNSMPMEGKNPSIQDVVGSLKKFLHCSSYVLLRLKSKSQHSNDIPGMFVFLDKFIQEVERVTDHLVSMSHLEYSFPYLLLRATYAVMYERQRRRGAEDVEG